MEWKRELKSASRNHNMPPERPHLYSSKESLYDSSAICALVIYYFKLFILQQYRSRHQNPQVTPVGGSDGFRLTMESFFVLETNDAKKETPLVTTHQECGEVCPMVFSVSKQVEKASAGQSSPFHLPLL